MTRPPAGGDPSSIAGRYWEERGGKPPRRPRHPLTPREEHDHLVTGSQLCNSWDFYAGHDEWEEVWRRAKGSRRHLLHGLIQVAVGYEHCKRGNLRGMRSLLRQGAAKLADHSDRSGVDGLRDRALADARRADSALRGEASLTLAEVDPPKLDLVLEGQGGRRRRGAVRIVVPAG